MVERDWDGGGCVRARWEGGVRACGGRVAAGWLEGMAEG